MEGGSCFLLIISRCRQNSTEHRITFKVELEFSHGEKVQL
jgi:hypothetical protein